MADHPAFELIEKRTIDEQAAEVYWYRHRKTGAELVSVVCDDDNKSFGINFRTPPDDSTGVAHILEHSVLCGSRKFPVKEPFKELMKGSLNTFLNAMTYPDKTVFPVASQNLSDFYNLVDVYLDCVLHPQLTEQMFHQEGWHYELDAPDGEMIYKGVVFNEMKGAYSSPDSVACERAQQSLFPGSIYGHDSGGKPSAILDLTYEQFKQFHETYYHPSNARIFFHGDDDPARRLEIVDEYLKEFDAADVPNTIAPQERFTEPKEIRECYAAGASENGEEDEDAGCFVLTSWLLGPSTDLHLKFDLHLLNFLLAGTPASPLWRSLISSGLGTDLAGVGLESQMLEMYFSTGLKGVEKAKVKKVQALIHQTLADLVANGFDQELIEGAFNAIEFALRENNTGSFPRGLALMLRSLSYWLYDQDPFAPMAYEGIVQAAKDRLKENPRYFEGLIQTWLIDNAHCTELVLEPDEQLNKKEETEEKARLQNERAAMDDARITAIAENTKALKKWQQQADSPEALASIPSLKVSDLDPAIRLIERTVSTCGGTELVHHDLMSNGIFYFDLAFDLTGIPQDLLPFLPLLGRCYTEMGTQQEDYIQLSQRISKDTGGLDYHIVNGRRWDTGEPGSWMLFRTKCLLSKVPQLLAILRDVFLTPRLDESQRFIEILQEEKAGEESGIVPAGHAVVRNRMAAHAGVAEWACEQVSGMDFLFALGDMMKQAEPGCDPLLAKLQTLHERIIDRSRLTAHVTLDRENWNSVEPVVADFLSALPVPTPDQHSWQATPPPEFELLTLPSQIHYVGKSFNLFDAGYKFHGSALAITRFLRNNWLWDRVRVQGGAYGCICGFDQRSGWLSFASYRDPNIVDTLDAYDASGDFLRTTELTPDELNKNLIGMIGDLDSFQLPDAKGYSDFVRYLTGMKNEQRQQIRDEILATEEKHYRSFGDVLDEARKTYVACVLGPEQARSDLEKATGKTFTLRSSGAA